MLLLYASFATTTILDVLARMDLVHLDLRFNRFTSVPSEVVTIPSLQCLQLDRNPINELPEHATSSSALVALTVSST